jgi:hypothetical protein
MEVTLIPHSYRAIGSVTRNFPHDARSAGLVPLRCRAFSASAARPAPINGNQQHCGGLGHRSDGRRISFVEAVSRNKRRVTIFNPSALQSMNPNRVGVPVCARRPWACTAEDAKVSPRLALTTAPLQSRPAPATPLCALLTPCTAPSTSALPIRPSPFLTMPTAQCVWCRWKASTAPCRQRSFTL